MWFQQESAICHTTRVNMALLQETIPFCIISRRGNINWPPRSCDLAPLDFFCGTTRKTVFMQINIRQVMAEIPPNMCKKWPKISSKESMLATLRVELM